MAARENQGLQIALIIFVMLTIVLIVTTFLFFRNAQEAQEKNKQLTTENGQKDASMRKATDDSTKLMSIVDIKLDKLDAVEAAAKKDFEAHGKGLAEADQNYRNLVGMLAKGLADANTRITEVTAHEKELTEKLAAEEAATKQAIAEYTQTIAKVSKDLEEERKKYDDARKEIQAAKDELVKKFDTTKGDFDDLTKKSSEQLAALNAELARLTKLLTVMNDEKNRVTKANEVPDGKVTWVNQRLRTAWINLGSDDGLRRQTSFSVFPLDAANPVEADRKGMLEVTQLLGRHTAEARIVEDNLSNPLMPGDQIFSPTWEPGRAEHFGLSGTIDVDGDGESDLRRVHELIALNGGVVDEEMSEDGKKTGQMSINTKYLVRGKEPADPTALAAYSEINGEAQTLGVRIISVNEFLDYMGYKSEDRTVNLGPGAKGSDFKPRLPGGVQRTRPNIKSSQDERRSLPLGKQ